MMQDVEHVKCGAMLCKSVVWWDMWWCDAWLCGQYMALSECGVEYMECGAVWYVSNVKCPGAMRDVVWCIMWPIWCDLKYGIAKWNSVLREVLWYEICVMVRIGDVMWNQCGVTWMPEMVTVFDVEWCNAKCGGNVVIGARCNGNVLYMPQLNNISHLTTFPAQHTIPHLTSFHIFNTTRSHITWRDVRDSVVWNLVWCGTFCSQMCLIHPNVAVMWNKVRCRICAISGVMLRMMSCNVMEEVWNVVMRCGIWWCAVMQDVKCSCGIPRDVEWFDAILDMAVYTMLNDGWNAVWDVLCDGLECVLWDSVMCNLYFSECGDVHGVVWGAMWE